MEHVVVFSLKKNVPSLGCFERVDIIRKSVESPAIEYGLRVDADWLINGFKGMSIQLLKYNLIRKSIRTHVENVQIPFVEWLP